MRFGKISIGILLLAVFISLGTTQGKSISPVNLTQINDTQESFSSEKVNLNLVKQGFNENSDSIPSFVISLIGDQTVKINLSDIDERDVLDENLIGLKTSGKNITDIKWGKYNNTTLEITFTEKNMDRLISSSEPLKELSQMLKNGAIDYQTFTLGNKIKFGIMEFFLGF